MAIALNVVARRPGLFKRERQLYVRPVDAPIKSCGRSALEKMIKHVLEKFEKEHARPLTDEVRIWLAAQLRSYAELDELRRIHQKLSELPTKEDLNESLRDLCGAIIAHLRGLNEKLSAEHPGLISVEKHLGEIKSKMGSLGEDIYTVKVMLKELRDLLRERDLELLPRSLHPRKPGVILAYEDAQGRKRYISAWDGMIIGRSGLDVVIKDEEGRVVRRLGVQDLFVSRMHAMLLFSGNKPVLKVLTDKESNTRTGYKIGDKIVETIVQKGTYTLEDGCIINAGLHEV